MKKVLSSITLSVILLLTSCANEGNKTVTENEKIGGETVTEKVASSEPESSNEADKYNEPLHYIIPSEYEDKTILTFVCENNAQNTITPDYDEMNRWLDDNGYDFAVEFYFYDIFDNKTSVEGYSELVEQGISPDLLMTGTSFDSDTLTKLKDQFGVVSAVEGSSYKYCIDNNILIPLNDYLADDNWIGDTFPDNYILSLSDNDGKIYGFTTAFNSDSPNVLVFDTDTAEEYGFDISAFEGDLSELSEILGKIYADTELPCFLISDDEGTYYPEHDIGFVKITDGIYLNTQTGKAENIFENETALKYFTLINDWSNKGYITSYQSYVKTSEMINYKILCSQSRMSTDYKTDGEAVVLSGSYINNLESSYCIGVTTASDEPDKAYEFLKLIMTEPELAQIMKKISAGVLNQMEYPFNNLITSSTETEPQNKDTIFTEIYENTEISPAYGFTPDLTGYEEKYNAICQIISSYNYLFTGIYESSDDINTACVELKEAGYDEILQEVNRQLEEYYETK